MVLRKGMGLIRGPPGKEVGPHPGVIQWCIFKRGSRDSFLSAPSPPQGSPYAMQHGDQVTLAIACTISRAACVSESLTPSYFAGYDTSDIAYSVTCKCYKCRIWAQLGVLASG